MPAQMPSPSVSTGGVANCVISHVLGPVFDRLSWHGSWAPATPGAVTATATPMSPAAAAERIRCAIVMPGDRTDRTVSRHAIIGKPLNTKILKGFPYRSRLHRRRCLSPEAFRDPTGVPGTESRLDGVAHRRRHQRRILRAGDGGREQHGVATEFHR